MVKVQIFLSPVGILIYTNPLLNLMVFVNSLIPFIASGAMLSVAILLGIRSMGNVKEKDLLKWLIPIFSISFVILMIIGFTTSIYDVNSSMTLYITIGVIIIVELIPSLICIILWTKRKNQLKNNCINRQSSSSKQQSS